MILISTCSWGAVTYLSGACLGGTSNTNTTAAINTTGATLLVVSIGDCNSACGSVPFIPPSDNVSNSFTNIYLTQSTDAIYYVVNPVTSTSYKLTAACNSTACYPSACVMAFSNTNSSSLDQKNNNFLASSFTIQPGNVSPTLNNELVVTAELAGIAGTASINGSFSGNVVTNGAQGAGISYMIQTTSTSENPTWTITGGSLGTNYSAIMTFYSGHLNILNRSSVNSSTVN